MLLAPQIVCTGPAGPAGIPVQELYGSNLNGTDRIAFTRDRFPRFLPHFSPDGRRVIYTKFVRGNYGQPDAESDAAVFDFASRTETLLTHDGVSVQPVWSPDGKQIAHGTLTGNGVWVMNADGSDAHVIARPSGRPDDMWWGDYLWSPDNWIYFSVAQNVGGCFKVRMDRIRPNGTDRERIDDGGPYCTPKGLQQSGDADPGVSPDGRTLYSSRGLPQTVPGQPTVTIRHLYRLSTEPYYPGKPETDLSRSKPDCVVGVPKVSPDGRAILVFLFCPNAPSYNGIAETDTQGRVWREIEPGFGADWNPR